MLYEHVDRGADMTVGCVEVPVGEAAGQLGVMQVDRGFKVIGFEEKPEHPRPIPGQPHVALGSMGIYVFNADFLYDELIDDAMDEESGHDFGHDLIPRLLRNGSRVYAHRLQDSCAQLTEGRPYWRDVGTVDAFWEANLELTRVSPALNLYDESWPIWTFQEQLPPAKFVFDDDNRRGCALDSIVSAGCIVSGSTVRRSLLSNNVRLYNHTSIEDSVILPNAEIGPSAVVKNAIVDKHCRIPDGMRIGVDLELDRKRFHVTEKGRVLVVPEMLGQQVHHLR